ncbi:MAG: fumarate hydratase [Methanomassiliicoccaceae archaeon]|jgi:fumarate hydratase subunit alpha|nr:fumarate hydratase [Methanomassiliicoccaceae archaeon]
MIRIPEPIEDIVVNLLRLANTKLPEDVGWALEAAASWETNETAYSQLGGIMDNVKKAEFLGRPMCQDTGMPVFYVSGRMDASMEEGIRNGVKKATETIPLRPNTVHPLTRHNHGDNLGEGMPVIHYRPSDADHTEITVLPKGAGSENMTRLAMLNPADGTDGIKKFIVSAVLEAGGRPCPPTVVGVGIGGTSDRCTEMAKEALLRSADHVNKNDDERELEEELFTILNSSGLGPMGLGGDTTVLRVHIKTAYCHTASLPVAVNLNCWASRRATVRIYKDGTADYHQR